MKRKFAGANRLNCLISVAGLLACFGIAACADTTSDWTAKRVTFIVEKQSFAAILTAVSKQIGKNIVADDEPLLKSASINIDGTAKDVLDKVGSTFDYSWALSRHGVVMLTKRFKHPDEVPQMNLPELRQMVKQSLNALSNVHCSAEQGWWGFQCKSMFELFTPEQQQELKVGKSIGYADWTADQRTVVRQMILNHRFGGMLRGWNSLDTVLASYSRASLQMQNYEIKGDKFVLASVKTSDNLWLCYYYPQAGGEGMKTMELPSHISLAPLRGNYTNGEEGQ